MYFFILCEVGIIFLCYLFSSPPQLVSIIYTIQWFLIFFFFWRGEGWSLIFSFLFYNNFYDVISSLFQHFLDKCCLLFVVLFRVFYKFMKFSDVFSGPLSSLFHKQWVVSGFPCYEALGFVLFHVHWASFHFFFFIILGHIFTWDSSFFMCLFACWSFNLSVSWYQCPLLFLFEFFSLSRISSMCSYIIIFLAIFGFFLVLSTTCLQLYCLVDFSKTLKYFEEY